MKLLISSFVLMFLTYKPVVHNITSAFQTTNDVTILNNHTWELDHISTENIPSNEEYNSLKKDIVNVPSCSLDDYINFDINSNCVQYTRNEKCVQEESDVENYNLEISNNEIVISQDNIEVVFFIKDISNEKLVLEIPLNYGETQYYYSITYRPIL